MERRTTLGIAGGITLTVAAAAAALGVNLGILSDSGAAEGPGTFQPTAAYEATSTAPTPSAPASTAPGTITVYVDENGNPVDPSTVSTTSIPADPTVSGQPATTVPRSSSDDDRATGRDHAEDGEHHGDDDDDQVGGDSDDDAGEHESGHDDDD